MLLELQLQCSGELRWDIDHEQLDEDTKHLPNNLAISALERLRTCNDYGIIGTLEE